MTKKGRRDLSEKYKFILNFADGPHKANLAIQDICQDDEWTEVMLVTNRPIYTIVSSLPFYEVP